MENIVELSNIESTEKKLDPLSEVEEQPSTEASYKNITNIKHLLIKEFIGVRQNELHNEIYKHEREKNSQNKTIGENYMSLFWNDRYNDGRKWGMFISAQQFVWQLVDFFNPVSHFHFMMNLGYITNTFICMCLFIYSFKEGVNRWVHVIPMLLLTTQQEIKMLDLENV